MEAKLEQDDIVMYDHKRWTVLHAKINKKKTKILISEQGEDHIRICHECNIQPPSISDMIETGDVVPVTPEIESQSKVVGWCMYG